MSDWSTAQGYPGESPALVMPARIDAGGKVLTKPTYLYGYSIAVDQTKQVQAIKLPGSPYVTILGVTLGRHVYSRTPAQAGNVPMTN